MKRNPRASKMFFPNSLSAKQQVTQSRTEIADLEMSLDHTLTVKIPFQNARHPNIVIKTLSPDPLLKETELTVGYSVVEDTVLEILFQAKDNRSLRLGVNSLLESLKLCVETIDEFDLA